MSIFHRNINFFISHFNLVLYREKPELQREMYYITSVVLFSGAEVYYV